MKPEPPKKPPYRSGPWPDPPAPLRTRRPVTPIAAGCAAAAAGIALIVLACGRDGLAVIPFLLAIFGGIFNPSPQRNGGNP